MVKQKRTSVETARRSRADARARYGLQRRKLQLTQTALKRPQVDAVVMSEKLLVHVSNIGDLPATMKFLQNPNAANDRQSFAYGQPSAFPFVHQRN
jgi:hypothetical protein